MPTETPESIMDKALANPKGLRLPFPDQASAAQFRMMCYNRRKYERQKNKRAGEAEECLWDSLLFRLERDEQARLWLYISPGLTLSPELL